MNPVIKKACYYAFVFLYLPLLFCSCKKQTNSETDSLPDVTPLIRPQGTLTGAAITKVIGTAGGTIQSADESITIVVPAGALDANTAMSIQPITNTNVAGIGGAFRLTPHGKVFSKPVTVIYSWGVHADSIGLLQTLGLAYQMEEGIWRFVGADHFDAASKTVSFKTTHFSDWSLMNRISLSPYKADVETGEKKMVSAMIFTKSDLDNLFVPLVNDPDGPYNEPGYPVGNPVLLPSKFIKAWKLNGPGSLAQRTKQTAEYQAPASVNGVASATVSLELNAPVPGTFLLLSNITIMGDGWIELSINGGAPVRFPATPVAKMGARYILSNPEDEGGGEFLLTWKGGMGSHPFDLAADGTRFHFITGLNAGYTSMYIPGANMPPKASEGSVTITKLGNGRAEGNFSIDNVGVGDKYRPEASALGRFSARLSGE